MSNKELIKLIDKNDNKKQDRITRFKEWKRLILLSSTCEEIELSKREQIQWEEIQEANKRFTK